jgi:hypothetical protein
VAFGQFVGQFVLAIWTLNEPKQNLSFFLFNTKVGFGKKEKQNVNGPVGLVESLVTPNSKDYKNPSH